MKEIKAYIKPHMLTKVAAALQKIEGLTGLSVVPVRGFGRGKMSEKVGQSVDELTDFVAHVKIEINCLDQLVDEIVSTIQLTANTGLRGDGKIYVSHVESALRISTGERMDEAV